MVSKKDQKIIDEATERFETWSEIEHENRQLMLEDVRFVDLEDHQWTEDAKAKREGRPCMTFDKVSGAVKQVVNDMLQNRPGIKIRAAEDGDADLAEIRTGLIRAIENTSNAKRAYTNAFKFAVKGGLGWWRIRHDWIDDESFYQDVFIEPVMNPFSVLADPFAQDPMKSDGRGLFIFEDLPTEEFESLYPKASTKTGKWDAMAGTGWMTDETVRVAEYYRRVNKSKEIALLSDGSIVDLEDFSEESYPNITVRKVREVEGYSIEYYKLTAAEILEKKEYVGKFIPVVPLYGELVNVDGVMRYRGMVRQAMDAQRAYNYELSNHIESSSLQPKAPYMATPEMIKGQEDQWENLNVRNDPVLLFNPDPQLPGSKPFRESPPVASQAQLANINILSDNIKSATGIYDASLGARSNETSGRAIMERDRQGDTATYHFTDELTESLQYTGRILLDLVPKVYDTERHLRILGEDEQEEIVEINKPVMDYETGEYVYINDLSQGKYDVVVTAGASYSTKRTETAEQLGQIMAQNPQMASVIGDVWVKSLDLIGGDEVIKRLRKIGIREGFIEPNEEEQAEVAPQRQQAQQMQQAAAELEMRIKNAEAMREEAEAMKTQAEAKTEQTEALLNSIEAQLKQVELAQANGDIQAMMNQLMVLKRLVM